MSTLAPKLSLETEVQTERIKPSFLSTPIRAEETEGVVIDCDEVVGPPAMFGGNPEPCLSDALYRVSCGGRTQHLCSLHAHYAFLNWMMGT